MPATRTLASLCACAALALLSPGLANAQQTPAALFSGGLVTTGAGTSYSLGWTFTVNSPIAVTALGFYDDNNTEVDTNGNPIGGTAMAQSHLVGIYDSSGNLLLNATVAPNDTAYDAYNNTAGSAGDGYQLVRYDTTLTDNSTGLTVPSFQLTPGQTYAIAGVTGDDNYTYNTDTLTAAPAIAYGHAAYYADANFNSDTSVLQFPNTVDSSFDPGFLGPSFQFTAAPEPSAWVSLALGALALAALRLRARKRTQAS